MFAAAARWVVRWWLSWFASAEPSRSRHAAIGAGIAVTTGIAAVCAPVWAAGGHGPSASAAQRRSQTAYAGLDSRAALRVAASDLSAVVNRRLRTTPLRHRGDRVVRYVGDRAALVAKAGGARRLVVSDLPLRAAAGSGQLAPIDLSWQRTRAGGFALANPVEPVAVAADVRQGATLPTPGIDVAPVAARRVTGRILGSSVFYANVGTDADYLVQPAAAGLEASFVLRSAASPEQLALSFHLRPGLSLRTRPGVPGSVEIVRGRRGVAATSPVHAVDATGRTVPVRAVLRDDRLVIDVPHRGRAVQYPVLVDPQVYEEDNDAWGWDYADDGSGVWTANGYPLGIGVYSQAPVGGRWAEETLTAPGTSSIVEFTGEYELYDYVNANLSAGIRKNGHWLAPPAGMTGNGLEAFDTLSACLCGEPTPDDAGDQAVLRVDLTWAAAGDMWPRWFYVVFSDPEPPTVSSFDPGASGWIQGGARTARVSASDPGTGIMSASLLRGQTTLARRQRSCSVSGGGCTGSWSTTLGYDAGLLPEGVDTLDVQVADAVGHQTTATAGVKVDRTAPSVTITGSATTPLSPGGQVAIGSDDGSTAIARAGIRRLHVSVDDVAQPDIQVDCTSGCPRTHADAFALDPNRYSEGAHTVTVTAEDDAGNVSSVATARVYVLHLEAVARDKLGLEHYFTYESTDTGADTAAHVNVADGNLVWHSTPIVNPGRGLASVMNLTYNSLDRGGYLGSLLNTNGIPLVGSTTLHDLIGTAYGEAGIGFSIGISGITRLNEPLAGVGLDALGEKIASPPAITLTDADGTRHVFTRDASRSDWYDAPPGVQLALRRYSSSDATRRWAATRPDGVAFFFDADGYQTYIDDRNGNEIRFEYEYYSKVTGAPTARCPALYPVTSLLCSKRVVRVVDPAGVDAEPTAPAEGAAEDPVAAGRSLDITYEDKPILPIGSGDGPCPDLIGPVGGAAGRIKRIVDHARRVTDFTYDADGYLIRLTQGDVLAPGGGATDTTGERSIELGYSGRGPNRRLATIEDPRHNTTTVAYEATDDPGPRGNHSVGARVHAITNRRGNTTTFAYHGHSTTVTRPGGVVATYQTDDAGRPSSVTNPLGHVTTLTWDARNNLTDYTEAGDVPGQAAHTHLTYDRLDNPLTVTDPNGHTTTLTYCYGTESGHSAGCQDHGTEYVGDLTRFQQPRGNGVSYTVDDAGNVTSQAYDGKAAATTHYAAGGHGLPDYAVDEVGDKTTYADYDANGLPRTVTDPRGNTGTTDPETSGIWRYDYDAVGNLLAVTDPRGTGVPETALSGDAKDNPFRFEGFELDNGVATYDMQARPYRPDLGRFTTPDRFEDSLGDFALQSDPLTQNRYAFGAGNPVNDVEFDGHCAPSTGSTLYGPCRALPGTPKRTAQRVNRRADAAGRRIDARNAAATRVAQHAQQVATTVARKVNFHYCQQGEDCSRQDTTQNVARLRAALVLGTDLRQVRLHRSYTPNASSPWLDLTLLTGGIAGDLVKGGAAAVASIFARGAAEGGAMAAAQACVRACKAAAKVLVRGRSKAAGDVSPTVGELRAAGQAEAHHVIQDAAVRDVLGYNTNEAPGIQLEGPSTEIGSPHYAATQVQRSAEVGGTYGAERQVACAALAAAGCSRGQIADALARADEYFMRRLDLTFESPLRIPGNRRIP